MPQAKTVASPLVFIDTNIFLDFYRHKNSEFSLKFLNAIKECNEKHLLIITSQVEMEYMKNRQKVILDSFKQFGISKFDFTPPTIVADTQTVQQIEKNIKDITKRQKAITDKIEKLLKSPNTSDPVYQSLKKLFAYKKSPYNLYRDNEHESRIHRLARKRFMLGYPPRKKGDTSYGDAVNWEWIIECAIRSEKNIVIVSRDNDFGVIYNKPIITSYLNNWLSHEFKKRLSQKRKVELVQNLSEGLRMAGAKVTTKMEKEEQNVIDDEKHQLLVSNDIE